jgi:hypothetical protein
MAEYQLNGLASGTTSISSTVDTANQPTINFPSKGIKITIRCEQRWQHCLQSNHLYTGSDDHPREVHDYQRHFRRYQLYYRYDSDMEIPHHRHNGLFCRPRDKGKNLKSLVITIEFIYRRIENPGER